MLLNILATSKHVVSHELNGSIYIQQSVTNYETGMLIITAKIIQM